MGIEYVPPPGVTLKRHAATGAEYSFTSMSAIDWLGDFTSIHGIEEASTMCAHWVRMGFIQTVDRATSLKVKPGEFVCRLRDKGERDVSPVFLSSFPSCARSTRLTFLPLVFLPLAGRLPSVRPSHLPNHARGSVVRLGQQPLLPSSLLPPSSKLVLLPPLLCLPR